MTEVKKRRWIAALLLVMAVLAAACGGDDDGDEGAGDDTSTPQEEGFDLGAYEAAVVEYEAPVEEYTGPTTAPEPVADKTIVIVSCTELAEGCTRIREGAEAAAEAIGWKTVSIDGKGDPKLYQQAVQRAIDMKADGILLAAIADATVTEELAAAREAGIIVGGARTGNVPRDDGENFELTANDELQGTMAGNYAVAATEGEARIAVFDDPEFPVVKTMLDGAREVIDTCDDCEIVAEEQFLATELVDRLPALTTSVMERDPSINFILSGFDAAFNFQVQALANAGITQPDVQGVSFDGNSANLENVRSGETVQSASVAVAYGYMGYAAMDNFNRVFAGEEPVEIDTPVRLFTSNNIADITVWDTDFDYASEFQAVWGL